MSPHGTHHKRERFGESYYYYFQEKYAEGTLSTLSKENIETLEKCRIVWQFGSFRQPLYQSRIPPAPNIQNTSSELLSSLFPLPPERDKSHRTSPHPYEESACMTHTPSDLSRKMTD